MRFIGGEGDAMTSQLSDETAAGLFESMRGARDAVSVRRVFGDAYEADGVTVIPVAKVMGGGGGGSGDGDGDDNDGGFGSGFGMRALPVGVYEIRGDTVEWKPAMDVTRLARGGQVLVGIIAVCVTLVLLRRTR